MTGDKMKSDCTMDSRYRSEGRPSLPRRRVATKTAHENGDFEMELSLAIKESLKYAKEKEGQLKGVDKTSPLLNGVKTDESFTQMAGKMLSFATSNDQGQGSEVQQLKDLLLIHIELIQHQQEQLANKDKEIRLLRIEKDTLQGRLLKAEKRCAVLKQKEESLEAQVASSRSAIISHMAPVPESIPKTEQSSGRKRKKQLQTRVGRPKKQKKVRKPVVDKTSDSVSSGEEEEEEEEDLDEEEEDSEEEEDDDREREEESDIDEEEEAETEEMVLSEKGNMEVTQEEEQKDPHPDPVLRTECLYHVACAVDLPPDEPVELNDEKEVVTGEEVETPGWRINVLKNIYQLEGTENITDEAYQKRHQKHEVEEKRRKRWDIQRMREQKVFEKLKGKEEVCSGNQGQAEVNLNTFLPSLDDLTHIEVADNVCVMAFGQAIPHVEPYEFELPWDTGPSSSYTRKSHGGRGRQK